MSSRSYKYDGPSQPLRFVRLNPRFDRDETLELLKAEVQQQQQTVPQSKTKYPLPIPWLNSKQHQIEFFAIPGTCSLNKSAVFQCGRVYGMDVTSGAAVAALLVDLYDEKRRDTKADASVNEEKPLRVLDLCCAPGLKLCMMGDLVPPNSTLIGVDISTQRISLCKNIVKKYHIDEITSGYCNTNKMVDDDTTTTEQLGNNSSGKTPLTSRVTIRLFCTDGTTFGMQDEPSNKSNRMKTQRGLVFDSNASILENQSKGKRKRMNKSARAREKRRLMELQQREEEEEEDAESNVRNRTNNDADGRFNQQDSAHVTDNREVIPTEKKEAIDSLNDKKSCNAISVHDFDRVLVDAECSTDGALRHRSIEKQQQHSSATKPPPRSSAWDDTNMNELTDLQKRLIESGFRLLTRGGIMVYSTCSLSSKQNEQVVHWLLDKYKDAAYIIPISFSAERYDNTLSSSQELPFIEEGSISGTVRFNPMDETTTIDTSSQIDCIMPGSGFFLAKIGKR